MQDQQPKHSSIVVKKEPSEVISQVSSKATLQKSSVKKSTKSQQKQSDGSIRQYREPKKMNTKSFLTSESTNEEINLIKMLSGASSKATAKERYRSQQVQESPIQQMNNAASKRQSAATKNHKQNPDVAGAANSQDSQSSLIRKMRSKISAGVASSEKEKFSSLKQAVNNSQESAGPQTETKQQPFTSQHGRSLFKRRQQMLNEDSSQQQESSSLQGMSWHGMGRRNRANSDEVNDHPANNKNTPDTLSNMMPATRPQQHSLPRNYPLKNNVSAYQSALVSNERDQHSSSHHSYSHGTDENNTTMGKSKIKLGDNTVIRRSVAAPNQTNSVNSNYQEQTQLNSSKKMFSLMQETSQQSVCNLGTQQFVHRGNYDIPKRVKSDSRHFTSNVFDQAAQQSNNSYEQENNISGNGTGYEGCSSHSSAQRYGASTTSHAAKDSKREVQKVYSSNELVKYMKSNALSKDNVVIASYNRNSNHIVERTYETESNIGADSQRTVSCKNARQQKMSLIQNAPTAHRDMSYDYSSNYPLPLTGQLAQASSQHGKTNLSNPAFITRNSLRFKNGQSKQRISQQLLDKIQFNQSLGNPEDLHKVLTQNSPESRFANHAAAAAHDYDRPVISHSSSPGQSPVVSGRSKRRGEMRYHKQEKGSSHSVATGKQSYAMRNHGNETKGSSSVITRQVNELANSANVRGNHADYSTHINRSGGQSHRQVSAKTAGLNSSVTIPTTLINSDTEGPNSLATSKHVNSNLPHHNMVSIKNHQLNFHFHRRSSQNQSGSITTLRTHRNINVQANGAQTTETMPEAESISGPPMKGGRFQQNRNTHLSQHNQSLQSQRGEKSSQPHFITNINHNRYPSTSRLLVESRQSKLITESPSQHKLNIQPQSAAHSTNLLAPLNPLGGGEHTSIASQQQYGVMMLSSKNTASQRETRNRVDYIPVIPNKKQNLQQSHQTTSTNQNPNNSGRYFKKSAITQLKKASGVPSKLTGGSSQQNQSLDYMHNEADSLSLSKASKGSKIRRISAYADTHMVANASHPKMGFETASQKSKSNPRERTRDSISRKSLNQLHQVYDLNNQGNGLPVIERGRPSNVTRNIAMQKSSSQRSLHKKEKSDIASLIQSPYNSDQEQKAAVLYSNKPLVEGPYWKKNNQSTHFVDNSHGQNSGTVTILDKQSSQHRTENLNSLSHANASSYKLLQSDESKKPLFKTSRQDKSASQIAKLRMQIKKKDDAYLSLKDEFERLKQNMIPPDSDRGEQPAVLQSFEASNVHDSSGGKRVESCIKSGAVELHSMESNEKVVFNQARYRYSDAASVSSFNELSTFKQRSSSQAHPISGNLRNSVKKQPHDASKVDVSTGDVNASKLSHRKATAGTTAAQTSSQKKAPPSKLRQPTKFAQKAEEDSHLAQQSRQKQRTSSLPHAQADKTPRIVQLLQKKTSQFQQQSKQDTDRAGKASKGSNSKLKSKRTSMPTVTGKDSQLSSHRAQMLGSSPSKIQSHKNSVSDLHHATNQSRKSMPHHPVAGDTSKREKSRLRESHASSKKISNPITSKSDMIQSLKQVVSKSGKRDANKYTTSNTKTGSKASNQNHKRSVTSTDVTVIASSMVSSHPQMQINKVKDSAKTKGQYKSTVVELKSKPHHNSQTSEPQLMNRDLAILEEVTEEQEPAPLLYFEPQALSIVRETPEGIQNSNQKSNQQSEQLLLDGQQESFGPLAVSDLQNIHQQSSSVGQKPLLASSNLSNSLVIQATVNSRSSRKQEDMPANDQSSASEKNKDGGQSGSDWNNNHNQPAPLVVVQADSQFRSTGEAFGAARRQQSGLVVNKGSQNVTQTNFNNKQPTPAEEERSVSNVTAMFQQAKSVMGISKQQSSKSRCDTPIHPNQVVDGIKFMQVEDPNYVSSKVFDECDHEQVMNGTPLNGGQPPAMNTTGQEFFQQQQQHQQKQRESTAEKIQRQSLHILKQLQKKKQAAANNSQGTAGGTKHAKVVVNTNNPFFAGTKVTKKNSSLSGNGGTIGNTSRSSVAFNQGYQTKSMVMNTGEFQVAQESMQITPMAAAASALQIPEAPNEVESVFSLGQGFGKVPVLSSPGDGESQTKAMNISNQASVQVAQDVFYSPTKVADNSSQDANSFRGSKTDLHAHVGKKGTLQPYQNLAGEISHEPKRARKYSEEAVEIVSSKRTSLGAGGLVPSPGMFKLNVVVDGDRNAQSIKSVPDLMQYGGGQQQPKTRNMQQRESYDEILDDSLVLDFQEERRSGAIGGKKQSQQSAARNLLQGFMEGNLEEVNNDGGKDGGVEIQKILFDDSEKQTIEEPKDMTQGSKSPMRSLIMVSSIENNDELVSSQYTENPLQQQQSPSIENQQKVRQPTMPNSETKDIRPTKVSLAKNTNQQMLSSKVSPALRSSKITSMAVSGPGTINNTNLTYSAESSSIQTQQVKVPQFKSTGLASKIQNSSSKK